MDLDIRIQQIFKFSNSWDTRNNYHNYYNRALDMREYLVIIRDNFC